VKQLKYLFVAITLFLLSCNDQEETSSQLSLHPMELNFDNNSSMGNISVLSNGEWSVASNTEWLTFTPKNGIGDGNITIEVTQNRLLSAREGSITVTQNGAQPQKVIINQLGEEPDIKLSPTNGKVSAKGGELVFTVTSNVPWILEIPESDRSWISQQSNTRTMEDKFCILSIEPNIGDVRQSVILIKSSDEKIVRQFVVYQEASSTELKLPQNEFMVPAALTQFDIPLELNYAYEITTDADWISFDQAGSTPTTLRFKLIPNVTDEPNLAKLTVKQQNGTNQATFTVMQYGIPNMRIGDDTSGDPLAFPGAEGYGKFTIGGRGGKVYEVTNLNDSGPGSLRTAVEASGPRVVVFRVSGTIALTNKLTIRNPYITIAGQTAPGDGICVKGYPFSIGADEVIIRNIRFRLGDELNVEDDALGGRYQKNIIIDHCSSSWSVDECLSIYACENVTIQWTMLYESLYNSAHEKGAHGFGGIWGSNNSTYHHNLLAHHSSRNPRFATGAGNNDYRNNVIYNWGYNSCYGGENNDIGNNTQFFMVNMVANYYKPGPATTPGNISHRIANPSYRETVDNYGKWYISDNYMHGSTVVTADNWNGGVQPSGGTEHLSLLKLSQPWPSMPIRQHTAYDAYEVVLEYVGAIAPKRDQADSRIVNEVRGGYATYEGATYKKDKRVPDPNIPCGIIDSQKDVDGWPELNSQPASPDTDKDGIPDIFEDAYGLDRNDSADGADYTLDPLKRYTNLEVYLHNLVQHIVKHQSAGASF
jgi:pectate lyase